MTASRAASASLAARTLALAAMCFFMVTLIPALRPLLASDRLGALLTLIALVFACGAMFAMAHPDKDLMPSLAAAGGACALCAFSIAAAIVHPSEAAEFDKSSELFAEAQALSLAAATEQVDFEAARGRFATDSESPATQELRALIEDARDDRASELAWRIKTSPEEVVFAARWPGGDYVFDDERDAYGNLKPAPEPKLRVVLGAGEPVLTCEAPQTFRCEQWLADAFAALALR